LIAAHSSESFSFSEIFNMDVSKAAKTCRLPGCGLFCQMMGMGVVPVFAGASLYLGVWFMSTQKKGHKPASSPLTSAEGAADNDDASEEGTKGLPIRWHHLQRGLLQLFLFTFAPITRRCAELLFCRSVFFDGQKQYRLVSDLSLECWSDRHMIAAVIAAVILLAYALVIPYYLLRQTQRWKNSRGTDQTEEEGLTCTNVPAICNPNSFLSASQDNMKEWDKNVPEEVLAQMKVTPTLNPQCEACVPRPLCMR